jgi:hypothetical protein
MVDRLTHLVIATPCYGGLVTQNYMSSVVTLQALCIERGIAISVRLLGGDALITRARNILVAQFLADETATHLLFIDADIGFEPDQVFDLLDADKDVAGAAYPAKRLDWPLVSAAAAAGRTNLPASTFHYVVEFLEPDRITAVNGFAKARYLGNGFMMIRREVFGKIAGHYPEIRFGGLAVTRDFDLAEDNRHAYFDCVIDPKTGEYLSEDYTFCKRWVDMGGEIWVNMRSKLRHTGPIEFQGDLMSTFEAVE